jgi:hypothetical protein
MSNVQCRTFKAQSYKELRPSRRSIIPAFQYSSSAGWCGERHGLSSERVSLRGMRRNKSEIGNLTSEIGITPPVHRSITCGRGWGAGSR